MKITDRATRRMAQRAGSAGGPGALMESLEPRLVLSAAFDVTGLTALRNDGRYTAVDGSSIGVAILDSGLYAAHPDLSPNFTAWYDAVRRTSSGAPVDPDGHGTHVAGTAAARNPAIGVATRANIVGVRVIPDESERRPRHDTVADGLNWVLAHYQQYNIRVVNMSLGVPTINLNSGAGGFTAWANLIGELERVGVTVVSASGNSYGDFASPGASVPAVFSTISVASTWEDSGQGDTFPFILGGGSYYTVERDAAADRLAASSQRSTLANQVAAPGQTIYSAWNGSGGNFYQTIQGTSMASPLVAGVVALMQDASFTFGGRYLSPAEVLSIIKETGDAIVDANVTTNGRIEASSQQLLNLPETGLTFRRVNAYRAIQRVEQIVTGGQGGGGGTPGEDQNKTIATAIVLPSVNGTRTYTVEGAIGSDGAVTLNSRDVDMYRVTLTSRGRIQAQTFSSGSGQQADTYLRVFGLMGQQIAADDNSGSGTFSAITTAILEPGTYYIGVSASGNGTYSSTTGAGLQPGTRAGAYSLSIALSNPDPNGVLAGAVPFAGVPAYFPGFIGADEGLAVGSRDVDFFQFIAPDDGTLIIDIDSQDYGSDAVDSYVRVFAPDLRQIAFNDDFGGSTDSYLEVAVRKGEVLYIAVSDYANRAFDPADPFNRSSSGSGGLYDLFLLFDNDDANGTVFAAVERQVGDQITGRIGTDFGGPTIGADGSKDVDFFAFTPSSSGLLLATASALTAGFTPSISLWTYSASEDDVVLIMVSTAVDAEIAVRVSAGTTYYFAVTGKGNTDFNWFAPGSGTGGEVGDYRLLTQLRPESDANTLADDSVNRHSPGTVSVGSSRAGRIGSDGPLVQGPSDVDVYIFRPSRTQTVIIRTTILEDESSDTVLRVFDSTGAEIAFNDDASDRTTGSEIVLQVVAGRTYYIGVNGYSTEARAYNVLTGQGSAPGRTGQYVLFVTAPLEPEISIVFNGVEIVSGDSTPSIAEGTDFGRLDINGQRLTRTYTIFNLGDGELDILRRRVVISGPNASEFTRVKQARTAVEVGGSTTFRVRFDPAGTGIRTATVTVLSNDADEPQYTFLISGEGYISPEIEVQGRGFAIASGDTTPRATDWTSFGSVAAQSGSRTRTYGIVNFGTVLLNLSGTPRVLISGEHAGDFRIVKHPRREIAEGDSSTFRVRFNPGATGLRTAVLTIVNNDSDEGTYTFTIAGTGV